MTDYTYPFHSEETHHLERLYRLGLNSEEITAILSLKREENLDLT